MSDVQQGIDACVASKVYSDKVDKSCVGSTDTNRGVDDDCVYNALIPDQSTNSTLALRVIVSNQRTHPI
jgi:hypothetical protein